MVSKADILYLLLPVNFILGRQMPKSFPFSNTFLQRQDQYKHKHLKSIVVDRGIIIVKLQVLWTSTYFYFQLVVEQQWGVEAALLLLEAGARTLQRHRLVELEARHPLQSLLGYQGGVRLEEELLQQPVGHQVFNLLWATTLSILSFKYLTGNL